MANDVSYFKVQGDATQYSFNDADLGEALEEEIYRAQTAEQDNAEGIAAETQRAEAAEGDLSTLTTTAKGSLVAAINEVDANSDTNAEAISTLNSKLYYKAGDAVTINGIRVAGYFTSGSSDFFFSVPVAKRMDNISGVTVTRLVGGIRTVRGTYANGVVDSGSWLDRTDVSLSFTVDKSSNTLKSKITCTGGFKDGTTTTNVLNNSPASAYFDVSFVFR